MKIAMLTDTYDGIGGTERAIKNSAQVLQQMGHEVKIIYSDKRYRLRAPLADLLKFNPHIVHVHTPGPLGNIGVLYGKSKDVPIVGHFHSLPEVKFYFEKDLEKKTIGEFLWKLIRYFYQACDVTIVPSKEILRMLEKREFENLQVVNYGIDLEVFKPLKDKSVRNELGYRKSDTVLLYTGWFREDKRVELLPEALAQLDAKYKLLLVGCGWTKKEVEARVKKLGLEKRVLFQDSVANEELVKFYNSADIYTNAAVSETLGFSMLEAMACGLPVVAAASPGAKEIISEGKNGFLAELNSPRALVEKIKLLEDKEKRASAAKHARELVEKKYSIQEMGAKLVQVYEAVLR